MQSITVCGPALPSDSCSRLSTLLFDRKQRKKFRYSTVLLSITFIVSIHKWNHWDFVLLNKTVTSVHIYNSKSIPYSPYNQKYLLSWPPISTTAYNVGIWMQIKSGHPTGKLWRLWRICMRQGPASGSLVRRPPSHNVRNSCFSSGGLMSSKGSY